jgi:hypothetical protein
MLKITIEILLTVFFIWGVWNENKLATLEKRLIEKLKTFGGKK